MIVRPLGERPNSAAIAPDSAWHLVEQSQQQVLSPVLLIPQPVHAVLAGDLAQALLPEAFGELPSRVVQAIRMHDTGWGTLDAAQIHRLRGGDGEQKTARHQQTSQSANPIPFVDMPAAEVIDAWKASIDETEKIAPECGYIVSHHFSLLTLPDDPLHATFQRQEGMRRRRILNFSKINPGDLERWTDALGFCDLLSLYLCCGAVADAEISRVHPGRRPVGPSLRVRQDGPHVLLSEPFIRAGTKVKIHGLVHPAPDAGSAAQELQWVFAS